MSDWFEAEAHVDRALEMYQRGRWAEAEAELRKALSLHPDQPEWQFNLGLTVEAAGRDAEALACYERAIELMPGESEPLVAAGIVASRLGQYERAIDLLERAVKLNPKAELAYARQIEAHVRLGQHDEAQTVFYMAQQVLEEPSGACLAMVAECLMQLEQYERAGWCLREALRLEPNLPRLRARLGAVYAATGRPQRALQLYLRELRDDPGNVDTLLEYGDLLLDLDRLPEATEKFRRVLELEPANVDAHFRLGEIALATSRDENANLEFELVLKLDQEYPGARLGLAEALLRRQRIDEACHWLRQELDHLAAGEAEATASLDPTRLTGLLLTAGMPREAVDIAQRAMLEEPGRPDLLRKLALARFQSGDRAGGMAVSRRVLRLDPTCVRSMHNLALAALEDGRLDAASGWIARGLKCDRHDDGLRRLRMRLWMARIASLLGRSFTARR